MRNLTKAYLEQGSYYYSESGDKLIPIDQMPSALARHRARAIYTGPVIPRPRTSTESIPGSTR